MPALSDQTECSRCVMRREDDPHLDIVDGRCNHCRRYAALLESRVVTGDEGRQQLARLAASIAKRGVGRPYDCVIGVSGGVDSTYVAKMVKDMGLRPLAVHVDNGWNSETAVANVEKTLKTLGIDLETVVLDLREFYDLQRAFLLSSTPDGDVPADHAIQATLWKIARQLRIRYVISGMNFRTEAMSVSSWSYGHSDWKYIRAVHRAHGEHRMRRYPHFGLLTLLYTNLMRRIRIVSALNYVDYDKAEAVNVLTDELNWTPYGGKHFESIYTRFYQGYVLPTKFGIDKRRGHLSDLINSGQMERSQAIEELMHKDYADGQMRQDRDLFLKKLGLTQGEFDDMMCLPRRSFRDYPNSYARVQALRSCVNWLRLHGWYPR